MVFAAKGNFDDAQNGVKRIFTDQPFAQELAERGYLLSSASRSRLDEIKISIEGELVR